ncbi:hypothetical protein ACFC3F_09115 [Microbacterium sp. NPDC055910]|uniref:DUF7882 family protein n=1 Tax=Microbacterium sp. NPDC055910 TaxID=3345659 RepID=UPI0035E027A4
MGYLYYGAERTPAEIPDRVLAHIKVVVTTKLRRNESFTLTWPHPDGAAGRTSIWLQPSIPLRFVFDTPEAERLDEQMLRSYAEQAHSSKGLVIDWREEHSSTAPSLKIASQPEDVPERQVA